MEKRWKELAWDIVQDRQQHQRRTFARLHCARCQAHIDITIQDGHAPDLIMQKIRKAGWEVERHNRARARCPACLARPAHDPDAPLRAFIPPPVTPAPPTAPEDPPMTTVRDATPHEKALVRQQLDKHFDDARGCYLDGYSDEKVGAELDLPWAMITKVREAAYGPIRVVPELEDLKARLGRLGDDVKAARDLLDRLEAEHKTLAALIASTAERLGVAA